MARHRLTGPGPGRPKGSVNKSKLEITALLKDIAMSEEYQESLRRRAVRGDVTLDKEILARVVGPIKNITELTTPRPIVIDALRDDSRVVALIPDVLKDDGE
jgi:hypothetical protein